MNVPDEAERDVGEDGLAKVCAGELEEALAQRLFAFREPFGVSASAKALLGQVSDEVSDVERRVPFAVEIQVDEEQPAAVDDQLVRVEVPVDSCELLRRTETRGQPIAGGGDSFDGQPAHRSGEPPRAV